jgi:Nitrate and nitrite sensing/ANTAR domain
MHNISPDNTILLAKARHIEELARLSISTRFVESIGWMIHQIQSERGASCLYLASAGSRFGKERSEIIEQNQALEQSFIEALQRYLSLNSSADAKQLTLISWILLGFEQLKPFRHQVTLLKIPFSDCIQSYTRLIGSLISLIFEITDNAVNSKISTYLVALYNLVQGKEFAGQERALGSYLFGSGYMQLEHQHKLLELIAQQDRHFELFFQFGTEDLRAAWRASLHGDAYHKQHAYRSKLTTAKDQQALQTMDGDAWFEFCSKRLTEIWHIQCQLVASMHETLDNLTSYAKLDLENTRTHLEELKAKQTPTISVDNTFFNLAIPVESAFTFLAHDELTPYPMESIISLLQQQSQQLAEIENELSETKKSLAERKRIERAKGLLMSKLGLNEMEAYKMLRNTAMEQNRKLIEIAENIILLSKQGQ